MNGLANQPASQNNWLGDIQVERLNYLNLPLGLFLSAGYMKIPPYNSVLCTSATILSPSIEHCQKRNQITSSKHIVSSMWETFFSWPEQCTLHNILQIPSSFITQNISQMWARKICILMCNYLPMYLRDLGDDPSVGNLAFSTYLSGVKSATCQMVVKEAKLPSKALLFRRKKTNRFSTSRFKRPGHRCTCLINQNCTFK